MQRDHAGGELRGSEAEVGRPLEDAGGALLEPAAPDVAGGCVEERDVRLQVEHGRAVEQVEPADDDRVGLDGHDLGEREPERVRPARRARRERPARLVVEERRHRLVPAGRLVEVCQHPDVREARDVAQAAPVRLGDLDPRRPGVVGDRLEGHPVQRAVRRADAADRRVHDRLRHAPVAERLDERERRPRGRETPEREGRVEALAAAARASSSRSALARSAAWVESKGSGSRADRSSRSSFTISAERSSRTWSTGEASQPRRHGGRRRSG